MNFIEEKSLKTNSSNRNIFINGHNIRPVRSLDESSIHEKLKDYFHINGYNTINEFESFLWPAILRGRHVLAISSSDIHSELNFTIKKRKSKLVTFFSPVLTLLIKLIERENELKMLNNSETEKNYVFKRQNGPRLLIVCSSCKNAQKIYEFISKVMVNDKNLLRIILLQGGANDRTYDIKLSNGCDVLICATPYCLLRMLGNGNTNLERLELFTIDEANIVLEKYPIQMKALMGSYANLLKVEARQKIAQFILFSSTWSNKLKEFVSMYFMDETILFESKLEASYFGNVNHIVHEVKIANDKLSKLIDLIKMNANNSIIIFINDNACANLLNRYLKKKGYLASVIDDQTSQASINSITNEWLESAASKQLILICSQAILNFLDVRNASCVIHFDFPQTKKVFSERLWVMSDNFKLHKNKPNLLTDKSASGDFNNNKEWTELQSHIFFTEFDEEFSEGLLKFLKRTGVDEIGLPKLLIQKANERIKEKEENCNNKPLCQLTKSYGECISPLQNCEYRHTLDETIDKLRLLSEENDETKLFVPSEGHIKVCLSFCQQDL